LVSQLASNAEAAKRDKRVFFIGKGETFEKIFFLPVRRALQYVVFFRTGSFSAIAISGIIAQCRAYFNIKKSRLRAILGWVKFAFIKTFVALIE
jgi:hypothetical protein